MSPLEIGYTAVGGLVVLIYLGMPIGIAMLGVSFFGVSMIRNDIVALRMLGAVGNDSLREYLFAVVPLFVLMGLLVTVSNVGKDTFDVFQKMLRRVMAGLGIATVFANAVFASITGISIASATVFSRVAVPEMTRHGYSKKFATGVVAGSSVLGMMIPPSLLMIVYAVLAEQSVGRMFLAGVGPGLLLSVVFAVTILLLAKQRKNFVFDNADDHTEFEDFSFGELLRKAVPILSLMLIVLGGLYGGFLNPTEAGAAGAAGALVIAILRKSLPKRTLWNLMVETGQITVSVLFLILAATFFSRMLALSGVPRELASFFLDSSIGPFGFLIFYLILIVILGCLIDSISIMLIAGALCGPSLGWSYGVLVSVPTLKNWLAYNLVYMAMFGILGAVSVPAFDPITTVEALIEVNESPNELIGKAMPLTVVFAVAFAILERKQLSPR